MEPLRQRLNAKPILVAPGCYDALTALMAAFTDRSLLEMREGQQFPSVPDGVPGTAEKRLYFPDWTHRLDPVFRLREEPPAGSVVED